MMVDSNNELDLRLEKILKKVFQVEKIELNLSMDEIPEWDSFKHYELIVAVEKEFQIKFKIADAIEIISILILKNKILKYLNEK
jgi:acyl carrier protein